MFAATLIFAVLLTSSGVLSQRIFSGECPPWVAMSNFSLTKYLGKWNQIARYEYPFEQNGDCSTAEYTAYNETFIKVYNTQKYLPNTNLESIEGSARFSDPSNTDKAELLVRFNETRDSDYWVLATDYETYSAVWSCRKLNETHSADYFWLLFRPEVNLSLTDAFNLTPVLLRISQKDLRFTVQDDEKCSAISTKISAFALLIVLFSSVLKL